VIVCPLDYFNNRMFHLLNYSFNETSENRTSWYPTTLTIMASKKHIDALTRIIQDLGTFFAREAKEQSLSGASFSKREIMAIGAIGGAGQIRTGDLAAALGVGQSAVTPVLDRLEERHILRRVRSTEDRRIWLVELTEAGNAAYANINEGYREMASVMLSPLTSAEQAQLIALLSRMEID